MSAVAVKDGQVREVTRSQQSTRNAVGLRWCPFCDHSSQLDRGVCRGCGAVFEENYDAPIGETLNRLATLVAAPPSEEEPLEPDYVSMCTCAHVLNHHNTEGQCRYRQHCNCEGFTPTVIVP